MTSGTRAPRSWRLLGGIDLDPASNAPAQEVVRASRYFTAADDGLTKRWRGRVFMNPPFSRGQEFGKKLLSHYERGDVEAAIMVLNAYSFDTVWFQPFWDYPVCVSTRPAFYKPGQPMQNSPVVWAGFVYLGRDFDAFRERFSELGRVLKDPTDRAWQKRFSRRPAS